MHCFSFHTIEAEEAFLRFASGDEAALGWMYVQLYGPLIRYGCRLLDDDFEVATLAQEAFIRLWQHRTRITSMLHAWRFLRLVLRWKCYAWYRNPANRFRRRCILSSAAMDQSFASSQNGQEQEMHEEQKRIIWKAIPCLPPSKQTILRLHFQYGFSCRQIAARFHTSGIAITRELQKSLEQLKAIIHTTQKLSNPAVKNNASGGCAAEGGRLQQKLLHLRINERKSFEQIASVLNMDLVEVQRQYLAAWKQKSNSKQQAYTKAMEPCQG